MVDLPKKKVGIVACSGEELPEGTVTRLAALRVLEQLRPSDTVTICLPLFLAGGEGDRAFARYYPTVAVDGCEQRCAARATQMYSGKPAASVVITELVAENGLDHPKGARRLDEAGTRAVQLTAGVIADRVDELLEKKWNRRSGEFIQAEGVIPLQVIEQPEPTEATCSCGSGIPVRKLLIEGQLVTLIALPLIFDTFRQDGKHPSDETARELLSAVKIYNFIPPGSEDAYTQILLAEFAAFCAAQEPDK
jgi:uncharacterized metal-binding protein